MDFCGPYIKTTIIKIMIHGLNVTMLFLFLCISQISSIFLLKLSNEFLKKSDFKKSYIANIVSIFLVLFTLAIIVDFVFVHPVDPFILAWVIMVAPVVAMMSYVGVLFVSTIIELENYYRFLPSYRITQAIVYMNLVAIFG